MTTVFCGAQRREPITLTIREGITDLAISRTVATQPWVSDREAVLTTEAETRAQGKAMNEH